MKKDLEKLITNLRTDKNRNRYPEYTGFRAPHKPFLLLAVMDLFAQGTITTNFIEPNLELVDTFNLYWSDIVGSELRNGSMAYPFSRLSNDGVWELLPKDCKIINIDAITSMKKLNEVCLGAKFEDEPFQELMNSEFREQLRILIINTYFNPTVRQVLFDRATINIEAEEYSRLIITSEERPTDYGKSVKQKVRDQGFRKTIVKIYNHRCAICGIRVRTLEGHTIIDASHIKPFSLDQNDHPTNGLALCKLCHWSFDKGLLGINQDYNIQVSKRVNMSDNFPGHLSTFSNRNMFMPEQLTFKPEPDNLNWHLKNTFNN
jgi:putative restriction endonuclease